MFSVSALIHFYSVSSLEKKAPLPRPERDIFSFPNITAANSRCLRIVWDWYFDINAQSAGCSVCSTASEIGAKLNGMMFVYYSHFPPALLEESSIFKSSLMKKEKDNLTPDLRMCFPSNLHTRNQPRTRCETKMKPAPVVCEVVSYLTESVTLPSSLSHDTFLDDSLVLLVLNLYFSGSKWNN